MNMINKLKVSTLLLALAVVVSSCADLSVENLNDPGREEALANPSDLVSLVEGSTTSVFFEMTNLWGVHMDGLADQMTSTNKFLSFWDFTEEPRLRINNRTTYADAVIMNSPWSDYNSGVSTANTLIQKIEGDGDSIVLEDGTDVTQKLLAASYFLRGISRGYISMIYDQGYIVNIDTDLNQLEVVPAVDIANAAIDDLDKAIQVADGIGSGFVWDFLPGNNSWNLAEFKTITNSFAARFLAAIPRTKAEGDSHDWSRVLSYADKAIGGPNAPATMTDFSAEAVGPYIFYNNLWDWTGFVLSDGSGYLPTDLKPLHLLDPNYPHTYPPAPEVLDPAQSNDPRIDYYNYTENFGFLNPSRNRSIFSNYWNLRMWCQNNCGRSGFPTTYYIAAETDYLRAEAYLRGDNDKLTAANILNNSPFGSDSTVLSIDLPAKQLGVTDYNGKSGGNSISATDSDAAFQRALLREYSVELHLMGGTGLQWFFMRRWDMLQPGTALHYAIPGEELEITGREYYTFGGAEFAGEEGTASGANNWKNMSSPKVQSEAEINSNTLQSEYTYEPRQLSIKELGALPFDFSAGDRIKGNN